MASTRRLDSILAEAIVASRRRPPANPRGTSIAGQKHLFELHENVVKGRGESSFSMVKKDVLDSNPVDQVRTSWVASVGDPLVIE